MNTTNILVAASLLLALPLSACAPKRVAWSDPSLPENQVQIEVLAPAGVLEQGASSDEPGVRARALDILIRTAPTPDAGGIAKRALWDPDGWVQQEAVRALADRMADPKVAAEAVTLLESFVRRTDALADPYARGAAAVRLAAAGHMDTKDALHTAWKKERADWRAAPLQLGALALGDREALKPLAETLANGDIALETDFLLDIGRSGETELADALREGDEWIEDEVRLPYAVARLMLGDDSGAKPVEQAINGSDPLVALEALDYLVELDHDKVVNLVRKGRTGGTDLSRAYAHMALAARGEEKATIYLDAMLSMDPEVRALAARLSAKAAANPDLDKKVDRIARKVLETALGDEDVRVRLAALRGATRVGGLLPEPPVRAHLADELLAVRVEAAGALLARGS